MDILLRGLVAVAIILVGIGAYWLVNHLLLARLRGRRLGLDSLKPGVPAILYFTSPGCVPCKTFQRPQLWALRERLGDRLQVIEIDAIARRDLADYWGVLSVPTTFIIDGRGRPRRVNHGAVSARDLEKQIQAVESRPGYRFSEGGVTQ